MQLTDTDIEFLAEAKKLIDKDTSKHYTIIEIARHVGLSESKLTRGFRQQYGTGLFEYLENTRLEKGKYLLETSNKTLKQISTSLGYHHTKNFSTAFKRKFGEPPTQWKKKFRS